MPDPSHISIASIAMLEISAFAWLAAIRLDPLKRTMWMVVFFITLCFGFIGLCLARFLFSISVIEGPVLPLLLGFLERSVSITVHNSLTTSGEAVFRYGLVAAYVVYRKFKRGGRPEVKQHWGEIKDGLLAIVVVGIGYFLYNYFFVVPREVSPPKIELMLTPNDSFSLDYHQGGTFDLNNKRQYLLVIKNAGDQRIDVLDLWLQFPYFIEAHNAWTRGFGRFSFQPGPMPQMQSGKVILPQNGCVVHAAYRIYGEEIEAGAYAHIALIARSEMAFATVHRRPTFIAGNLTKQVLGKTVDMKFYVPLYNGDGNIVKLGQSTSMPNSITTTAASRVLASPCIPDAALMDYSSQ